MQDRRSGLPRVAVACALLVSQAVGASAQSQVAGRWETPGTAWGEPDLQGVWTSATLTPPERPAGQAGRERLTVEEAAAIEQATAADLGRERRQVDAGRGGQSQPGVAAHHRQPGTPLIINPPHGRIPWLPGEREAHDCDQARYGVGPFHSHTDADTGERCITDALPNLVPLHPYNMNLQILQTPAQVVMLHKIFHELRVIPLDGRPLTAVAQWTGEAQAPWEGDTLVVETVNFADKPRRVLERTVAQGAFEAAPGRAGSRGAAPRRSTTRSRWRTQRPSSGRGRPRRP